jgi:hypothetical protein
MVTTDTTTIPQPDGLLLHFLKELPAWCVITVLIVIFLGAWFLTHADFIPRILDALLGGLMTSIISQRPKPATTIKADTVDADTIDHSTVNATNLNVKNKEK